MDLRADHRHDRRLRGRRDADGLAQGILAGPSGERRFGRRRAGQRRGLRGQRLVGARMLAVISIVLVATLWRTARPVAPPADGHLPLAKRQGVSHQPVIVGGVRLMARPAVVPVLPGAHVNQVQVLLPIAEVGRPPTALVPPVPPVPPVSAINRASWHLRHRAYSSDPGCWDRLAE